MQLGVIGLGRMGANISRRLMRAGHSTVVWDANPAAVQGLGEDGATRRLRASPTWSAKLSGSPRAVWVMLPHGKITEDTIAQLAGMLGKGDIIIDGGNTYYKDDVRRGKELAAKGLRYLDVGTSGGVWGLERGYCLMIGGDKDAVNHLDPIFKALAPGIGSIERTGRPREPRSARRAGLHPCRAGRRRALRQDDPQRHRIRHDAGDGGGVRHPAKAAPRRNCRRASDSTSISADIAEVWRRGSVVTSWLLDLTSAALAKDAELSSFSGVVEDSGEGRWTVEAAIEEAVPAEVLAASLFVRFRSRQDHTFAEKVLSAMRFGFGGHVEAPAKA